ncbi:MAG: ABC transporter ATP-binding protein [Actinomycetia bacterium]|nr:ABC transporter ATP-binding protein [Actinomycetes bacterium]
MITVEHVSVWIRPHYGEIPVLDDISVTISQGETLGLVGESGSGKTLLARSMLGLLPPTATAAGRVLVGEVDVLHATEKELRELRGPVLASVFQDALVALNPSRTVGGHFADVWRSADLSPRNGWRSAAREALELVALRDVPRVLESYPHELSGGMRQRALIALALLRRPAVLVADEPTTALDRIVEAEVLELLENLQRDLGLAIVLISHDLDVIRRVCRRVAVLYGGQLCELGPADEVLRAPLHHYTSGLIGSVDSLARRTRPLLTIPGTVPHPQDFPAGCRFAPRCHAATEACSEPRPAVEGGRSRAWCHHSPVAGAAGVRAEELG